MNYQAIYDKLIERARHRAQIDGQYYEVHHVLPRALGGNNNMDNLVALTGREHCVAHKVLARAFERYFDDFKVKSFVEKSMLIFKKPSRRYLKQKLVTVAMQSSDVRKFLSAVTPLFDKILEIDHVELKYINWEELQGIVAAIKTTKVPDADTSKAMEAMTRLFSMEFFCGRKGFLERNGGNYGEIYDMFGLFA